MSINKENVKDIKLIDKIIDGSQQITYDNANSGLNATTIKGAIDELATNPATVDTFTFDTNYVSTGLEPIGTLKWNPEDETLDLVVSPDVTYQLGQEQGIVARNLSGVTIFNGAVVKVTGASGNKITIDLADAATETDSSSTYAIVTEEIADNSTGRVTTTGLVRGLDTSAFTEGVALWLGNNGQFTDVKPLSPNHLVHLGWVVRSHAAEGMILVKVSNGWEMEELHDVLVTSAQNGDVLIWNSASSVWENISLSVAIAPDISTAKQQAIDEAVALAIALG